MARERPTASEHDPDLPCADGGRHSSDEPVLPRAERDPTGLHALAAVAAAVGGAMALLAPGWTIAGALPAWDAALVTASLALLASVVGFPDWWRYGGETAAARRGCDARRRRLCNPPDPAGRRSLSTDRRSWERRRGAGPSSGCRARQTGRWPLAVHRGDGCFQGLRTGRRDSHTQTLIGSSRRPRG